MALATETNISIGIQIGKKIQCIVPLRGKTMHQFQFDKVGKT